jgi:hypothetical protein
MCLHLAAFAAISVLAEAWSALLRVIFDPWHRSSPPTVYNDGPWEQEDMALAPHRVGLGNLRTRLKILHGDRSELLLQPAEAGGVEVIVTLPLQEA